MSEDLNSINESFKKSGMDIATAQYSITDYSLNTDLSFKFANVSEFLDFLELNNDAEKAELVKAKVVESNVNPDSFFYVNFYKPKVAEL